ncbi:MAG: NERD domain-containing protein [Clostridia bacterium]|nr:NERD domain-containing protein [Clostridia bacterium]
MGFLKKLIRAASKPIINDLKGQVGEAEVDAKLNPLFFGKVEHRQINNLILMDENGRSHQIDHIEIRQNGIFCIETKNYGGWIFGSENQNTWTQCLYGGERHQITNPLKQNKSHIYHLNRVLNNQYRIHSVVVMVKNNADRIGLPNVVNLDNLKSYLQNFDDGTYYSIEEMNLIYNKLLNSASKITNEEHVQNIRRTQDELKEGICPRCGGKLVERNGRYGKFFGCSNYPNCRFIQNSR